MSRVGRRPVLLGQGVTANVAKETFSVKGPKGNLSRKFPEEIDVVIQEGNVLVSRKSEDRLARAKHGMMRNLIQNMVQGVSQGFTKELDIQGVGYRAELKGKNLQLALGFSHPVLFPIPEGIQIQVANQTKLTISGCDKELVGQTAANIRGLKPPEPYQGKGIRYLNEVVKRKVGKQAAGAAGG
ncbi:MAG: 50S ribosomal protein L6 [Deltaproteobacteria bacterium RIFCSPLOWO2_01_44_7]|nr:MAG: 50S ribosomal protein L6 [Deltaproteobacteria bacterium RIFCSPHIGHO2_01_FULL_43_49]OGQ14958.1 MAG: 50S ribosomal protein L6 [Deltaproteobacteria bacterium RIFCSPHIGHO2_02_FULL_44_53]OGQ29539.1 MAG: 50S ribosomal protein L6 [Deltaproteobacteria bacterium RIFCSPHIGHO2_12_FULL_44_21]OGQ31070.1 MAG: 50S ribosomal protein L6 [Deltaproteobacteria bacterium RIFCSPLOWO2_01_FULL_45_74]OGQ38655.1 MAG: 50S ribosomal protein L6 [Deltaproteobacteria bacterium RIFCSPLOWO2_01_44_7]OGQ42672.1 MAG: 50S